MNRSLYLFVPGLIAIGYSILIHADLNRSCFNRETFTCIYRINGWGDEESRSGPGSSMEQTEAIRTRLPDMLSTFGITTLFDAACGDFNWMQHVNAPSLKLYIGVDIVPDVIQENIKKYATQKRAFLMLDITCDKLPQLDKNSAIICRDCLTHLTFDDIKKTFQNFKKTGARYLMISTYPNRTINLDINTASMVHLLRYRPLNFQIAPFNFPPPLFIINEGNTEGDGYISDKSLALWAIEDLPIE